jgi:hypothetical protein
LSTAEETDLVLDVLPFLDVARAQETPYTYWDATMVGYYTTAVTREIPCVQPATMTCADLVLADGVLKSITLFPNYTLTIGDVVAALGEADYVSAVPWGAECYGCGLDLLWQDEAVWAGLTDTRCSEGHDLCSAIERGGPIDGNLVIKVVTYFDLEAWSPSPSLLPWPGLTQE